MPETNNYVVVKTMQPIGGYREEMHSRDDRSIQSEVLVEETGLVMEEAALTDAEVADRLSDARPHVLAVEPVKAFSHPPQPGTDAEADSQKVTGARARALHGLDKVHEQGYQGQGEIIAILDTGISPELAARLKAEGRLIGVFTHVPGEDGYDRGTNGHGPWCCETAANGAPKAKIISVQVLRSKDSRPGAEDNGSGLTSWIITGGQTAKNHGSTVNSRSLGGEGDQNDASSRAVNAERTFGISCPCAAGNEQRGTTAFTADRHSPGCAERAMSCAACDSERVVAPFSSHGNTVDVMGIGVLIEAGGRYMSGTSMWTPLMAAILACLRSAVAEGATLVQVADAVGGAVYAGAVDSSYPLHVEGKGFVRADASLVKLLGTAPVVVPPPQDKPLPDPVAAPTMSRWRESKTKSRDLPLRFVMTDKEYAFSVTRIKP